jgi:hypothetical protein
VENPKKPNFISLSRNKVAKISRNPMEIFSIPRLTMVYLREFRHQRRFLSAIPHKTNVTHSSRRLNAIIRRRNFHDLKYLEVGVAHGYSFEAIRTDYRIGVDPFPKSRIRAPKENFRIESKTSDEFFRANQTLFDIIFVDGMHTFKQSYTDIINSINALRPRGVILVDDVLPGDRFSALPDIKECNFERSKAGEELETWSGDVFKSIVMLREIHPEVNISTIISPNHPQTLIWLKPDCTENFDLELDLKNIEKYSSLDYDKYFVDLSKINPIFNFQMEWASINHYIGTINAN